MDLKIVQWNLRNFSTHRPYLQHLIDRTQPDIICLQETHLKDKQKSRLSNYQFPPLRKDRSNALGGGVAIFIKNSVPYTPVILNSELEVVACKIYINNSPITICSLYLPPDMTPTQIDPLLNKLIKDLQHPLLISADINSHHPLWGSPSADSKGRQMVDILEAHNLSILNSGEPTYLSSSGTYSHIDITFCSTRLATRLQWTTYEELLNSDHFPIIIESHLPLPEVSQPPKWKLDKADWSVYQKALKLPSTFMSPTQACGAVTDAIINAAKQAIPLTTNGKPHKSCYWWTKDCSMARKAKNKALSQYKNHRGNQELWIKYKAARAKYRHTTLLAQKESWTNFLQGFTANTSSRQIWQQVRKLRSKYTPRLNMLREGDSIVTSPQQVAENLAIHFSNMCSGKNDDPVFLIHKQNSEKQLVNFKPNNQPNYNKPFSKEELYRALKTATSKSPGPDHIPYSFLQQMNEEQLSSILKFYNYIYRTGYPHQWREEETIPIAKPGKDRLLKTSQRPITLLSCLSKLMEKLVNRRLQEHLESIHFYNPSQSGFRAKHCTLDNICRLEHDAHTALLEGKFCVAVLLDIARAFDSVWHHGLLQKLKDLGLTGNLPNFIKGFLTARRIKVRIQNCTSSCYPLSSGVPQGSILSPTLFSIYINDLFRDTPANVNSSLYADDGAMWVVSRNLDEALTTLQDALHKIENWSQIWGLTISPNKTNAIIFSRRHTLSPPALKILNTPIPYTKEVRFLGLIFDRQLTWKSHINSLKDRCSQDLQLLRVISNHKWGADLHSLSKLYSSLLLPKMEYANIIFENAAQTTLQQLDRIQYAAARIILGALKCTPTFKLEAEANLMPRNLRRKLQLALYGIKILQIPDHPIKTLYDQYQPYHKYLKGKYKISTIGRLHEMLERLQIDQTQIPTTKLALLYRTDSLPVYSTLATQPKNSLTECQWDQLFQNLINKDYPEHKQVYTDGSLSSTSQGSAAWSKNFSIQAKLPKHSTIYSAELYAIFVAVKFTANLPGPHVLFTDSLGSVMALKSLDSNSHYLVHWIAEALQKAPKQHISIEWIPSHKGIKGNEQADKLAQSTNLLTATTNIHPSKQELSQKIKVYFHNQWKNQWRSLPSALTAFKAELGPTTFAQEPRHLQVTLSRMRMGVTLLTHKHLFTKEAKPICNSCKVRTSVHHILIVCPQHEAYRPALKQGCSINSMPFTVQSILSGIVPAATIATFLAQTATIDKF